MNEEREKLEKEMRKKERRKVGIERRLKRKDGREILVVNNHPQLFRPSQDVKNRFTIWFIV